MLASNENCTWTAYDQILDRVTDEDHPINAQEPNETTSSMFAPFRIAF
jgi:hypothetical protein